MHHSALVVFSVIIVLTGGCAKESPHPIQQQWDPFLDTLQQRTFQWFWDTTPPQNGLTPDRYPTLTFSSIAAVGFALTSYAIGVERGYVSREAAADRVLTTLKFFWYAPQSSDPVRATGYKGFFYHFLFMDSGLRFNDVELSTIDTALLLAGMLFCQTYFDRDSEPERAIRSYADSIYRRVDWQWFRARPPRVTMGWRPESGFGPSDWKGYDEGMILYILALGSPTFPIEPEAWKAWTETYRWDTFYGEEYVNFAPLFGHQYSHCWIDFRGIQDDYMRQQGIDYFENSRRATYVQQRYAKENPGRWRGYDETLWGFSACDGPGDTTFVVDGLERRFIGYGARGPSSFWTNDDGTITPTAPAGSLPFAPEICIPVLKTMRTRFPDKLWREYGFADAFNLTFITDKTPEGWFDVDYLGIDQGPIVLMIENLRSEFVWSVMKKNPYIVRGLQRAGFSGGWLEKQ
jgi:hypothetical protein